MGNEQPFGTFLAAHHCAASLVREASVKAEDIKASFGENYPDAIVANGERIPLSRQTKFTRIFCQPGKKHEHHFSRFMDGSASITAAELQSEWPTWDDAQRTDFCQSSAWLCGSADFPLMLRFIMQNGGPDDRSAVASSVATELPRNEAFDILIRELRAAPIGRTANITQAISLTKHRDAEATLRGHLHTLWTDEGLWEDAEFINWIAFDATCCISHLLEIGASPAGFEDKVRQLSRHSCAHNRDSCCNFLSKHFSWLK